MLGLFGRLSAAEPQFARWGTVLGLAGTLGAAIHGGYDLALALNPVAGGADLPSQIDPRGLLTFGVTGLALLVAAWLIGRSATMPRALGYLTYVAGALLVLIYVARLIVVDPANPVLLVPVLISGFVVVPVWYVWLGLALRGPSDSVVSDPAA